MSINLAPTAPALETQITNGSTPSSPSISSPNYVSALKTAMNQTLAAPSEAQLDVEAETPTKQAIRSYLDGEMAVSSPSLLPPEPDQIGIPPVSDSQFRIIVNEVKQAIESGVQPLRIKQGSSGSYFVRDRQGTIVGVFKPKNEEPYGHLNPKWTKWLHKNLLPCCFGRSCLIPNLGYISEAGASFIDRRLNLNIVPRTEVISLASPAFYYSSHDLQAARSGRKSLPPKIGSFQLFLRGFKDASVFFREGYDKMSHHSDNQHPLGWTRQIQKEFQLQYERLVCLDYLIRNTDRGMDNWMIKDATKSHSSPRPSESRDTMDAMDDRAGLLANAQTQPVDTIDRATSGDHGPNSPISDSTATPDRPHICVAGIDHGLAFPFKHPDEWRAYPFGWAFLPISRTPFSKETCLHVLPMLTSPAWWTETFAGLEKLFKMDKDFDESMFRKQKAIMRGQGYNLAEVLRRALANDTQRASPWALVHRPPVAVFEEEVVVEEVDEEDDPYLESGMERGTQSDSAAAIRRFRRQVRQRFEAFTRSPWFTTW